MLVCLILTLLMYIVFMVCVSVSPSDVIRGYAQEVEVNGVKNNRDTPSSFTGHSGAGRQTYTICSTIDCCGVCYNVINYITLWF